MTQPLITPVAFFIFNRPDTTRRVFEEIRKVRPATLLVVADGPRTPAEASKCRETRAIIETVDWPCRVLKNYSETNLGCKIRVSSGLDWVFDEVEEAIILEDDCLPSQSFFFFCQELLNRYRNDERIMHITGDNFQATNKDFNCPESYYFTHITHIWGWASWRRAWRHYDVNVRQWPAVKQSHLLSKLFREDGAVARWEEKFQDYYEGKINSWDGQWSLACFAAGGLCVVPRLNLISNIGLVDATHAAHRESHKLFDIEAHELDFPLVHPRNISVNIEAENFVQEYMFGVHNYRGFGQRLRRLAKKHAPGLYSLLKRAK